MCPVKKVKRKKRSLTRRVYDEWYGFPAIDVVDVDMERTLSAELVLLGLVDVLMYISDKGSPGKAHAYEHKFGARDRPPLLYDPARNYLIIPGPPIAGNWRVGKRGLVG